LGGDVLSGQLALNDHLCRDARVISPRLPERIEAIHAMLPNQRIHQRVLKAMAHMERACDIRGRQRNAITGLGSQRWLTDALSFPACSALAFNLMWRVVFFHSHCLIGPNLLE